MYIHISSSAVSFIAVLSTAVVTGCHDRCRISVRLSCPAVVSDQTNTLCTCVCVCACACVWDRESAYWLGYGLDGAGFNSWQGQIGSWVHPASYLVATVVTFSGVKAGVLSWKANSMKSFLYLLSLLPRGRQRNYYQPPNTPYKFSLRNLKYRRPQIFYKNAFSAVLLMNFSLRVR
jgi:hypothetical protein